MDRFTWSVEDVLNPSGGLRYACLLLNRPLADDQLERFTIVWNRATRRVLVDGGANVMFRLLHPGSHVQEGTQSVPTRSSPKSLSDKPSTVSDVKPPSSTVSDVILPSSSTVSDVILPSSSTVSDVKSSPSSTVSDVKPPSSSTVSDVVPSSLTTVCVRCKDRTKDLDHGGQCSNPGSSSLPLTEFLKASLLGHATFPLRHPHVLSGDLDSVTSEAREFFTSSSRCWVVETADQDHTDFSKALSLLSCDCDGRARLWRDNWRADNHDAPETGGRCFTIDPAPINSCWCGWNCLEWMVAVGDCSGRLDQILACINTLAKLGGRALYLLASDSISWLLVPGSHRILLTPGGKSPEPVPQWCSLAPVCGPVLQVSTRGLRWNLDSSAMRFGGLVSTSNRPVGGVIIVETSGPLLFTLHVPSGV